MAWRRLVPSHPLGHSKATIHITYNGLVMKMVCCRIALMRICIKYWYVICMESVYSMGCMNVCFKWYYMCHMSYIQTAIFRGISNPNEWTTEVYLFNNNEHPWYPSHIFIINTSFWKLEISIRSSLTVPSVGCFRMPSSSMKHTGPTHDTCLENALMEWVPWWTRPYRTAHASPLKRGKHAQCEKDCDTLLDELSVCHIIWNITASTDLYLYIVICLCLYELHIVSVYIWYLSNFDCKLKFLLSSV